MKNKLLRYVSILCIIGQFVLIFGTTATASTYENITDLGLKSKSAILIEADTGAVIYEQNSDEKLPPASVTKIMTLLLIYEAIADGRIGWDDMVTVSEHAANMGGSQIWLEATEQQTVQDMVKCIAIASANDAAVAMAELIGGSEDAFVELMNKRAKELGMNNTTFVNACGLDADGHVTTSRDIAIMSRELICKFPEIAKFTTTWQDTIIHKTRKGESEFGLTNTNKLIKWYDGATGLKTGSTKKAMYCLSGTAEKNGMKLIAVVMAAPDFKIRFNEVIKLFDYGYANFGIEKGVTKGEKVGTVAIGKGIDEWVDVIVEKDALVLMKKGGKETLKSEVSLSPVLNAPFDKGTKAGEIIYTVNDKEVGRVDIVTRRGVEKITAPIMMKRLIPIWCGFQNGMP